MNLASGLLHRPTEREGMLCQSLEDLTDDPAGFEQLLPLVVAEGNPEASRVEVLSPWRNFRREDQGHH
jgi:hypothetical protein